VSQYSAFFQRLGKRIRNLRLQQKLSQEDMIYFGFSARHWQQIEAGRPLTMTTLLRISEALEIAPDRLIAGLHRDVLDPSRRLRALEMRATGKNERRR